MKIVPKVLGINQCSFTILSPDLQHLNILANLHTITASTLTLIKKKMVVLVVVRQG
jgi:hypothetical protein